MSTNEPKSNIGDFAVVKPLGSGAFGRVLLVENIYTKQKFAMKVIQSDLAMRSDLSEEEQEELEKEGRHFLREAQTLQALDHPHIIKVFHYAVAKELHPHYGSSFPYFTMPVAKGNLRQVIRGERFKPEEVVMLLEPIAQALDYAYEFRDQSGTLHHIIHRDVKPENILIGEGGKRLLADFGVAVVATRNSITDQHMGTIPYLPPECFLEGIYRPTRKQDIYAMGVIAYEMFCDQRPHSFSKTQDQQEGYKKLYKDPNYSTPSFASKGVDVDSQLAEVEKVVRQCLAPKAENRPYNSCMDFITALKEASTRRVQPPQRDNQPQQNAGTLTAAEHRQKGNELHDHERYQEALEACDQDIRLYPKNKAAHYNRGVALSNLGRYQEALEAYDKAIRFDRKYAKAHGGRGVALDNLGKYEEALEAYDWAIRFDPKVVEAHNNKGTMLSNLGRYEEALEAYDWAIRFDPRYATAYYNKGNALYKLGKYQEALEAYDWAILLDPKNELAVENRKIVLGRLGRSK